MKLFITLFAMCVIGCSALQVQSTATQIDNINKAVTTILVDTDNAYKQHLITKAQAQAVSKVTEQIGPLLDSAQAANAASDTAGANKTITLINSLLAGLQAYVPPGAK